MDTAILFSLTILECGFSVPTVMFVDGDKVIILHYDMAFYTLDAARSKMESLREAFSCVDDLENGDWHEVEC